MERVKIIRGGNMLRITDLSKLKITNIKGWRINFRYEGLLYSLNEFSDGCEYIIELWCRDTKECIHSEYGSLYLPTYIHIPSNSRLTKPLIYSHIDKEFLVERLYTHGFISEAPKKIMKGVTESKIRDIDFQIKELETKMEILKNMKDVLNNRLSDEFQ